MKTKLIAAFLFLSAMTIGIPGIHAQQQIEQTMTRVEGMNNVNTNVVINKNKETGAVERIVKTVSIMSNKNVVSDFVAAFDREKDNAYQISESSSAGSSQRTYRFRSGDRDITCSLKIFGGSNADVSYIDRDVNASPSLEERFFRGLSSLDTMQLRINMQEFGRDVEAWAKEFGEKVEGISGRIDTANMSKEDRFFRGLPAE